MIIKLIAIVVFITIVASLAYALYKLSKNNDAQQSAKILKALTIRISLSVLLFLFIVFAMKTGLLQPHGIGMQIYTKKHALTEPNQ